MEVISRAVAAILCDLSVEVWALDDVLMDPVLRSAKADQVFHKLIEATATQIIESYFEGRRVDDGMTVDMMQDGKISRVHLQIKRKGRTYTALISTFQFEHRTPSIITDGMALVEGERQLVARFIAFRDMHFPGPTIEQVPTGPFSDHAPNRPQRRPQRSVKPMIHRILESLLAWGRGAGKRWAPALASAFDATRAICRNTIHSALRKISDIEYLMIQSLPTGLFIDACRDKISTVATALKQAIPDPMRNSPRTRPSVIDIRLPVVPDRLVPDLAEIHGIRPERGLPQPTSTMPPPAVHSTGAERRRPAALSSYPADEIPPQDPRRHASGRTALVGLQRATDPSDHDATLAPWSDSAAQPPSQSRLQVL